MSIQERILLVIILVSEWTVAGKLYYYKLELSYRMNILLLILYNKEEQTIQNQRFSMGNHIILSANDNKSARIALRAVKVITRDDWQFDEFYRNAALQHCCDIVWNIYNVPILQRCVTQKIVVAKWPRVTSPLLFSFV